MKQLPILFSTPMVQAIQINQKFVTRRTRNLDKVNQDPDRYKHPRIERHYVSCPSIELDGSTTTISEGTHARFYFRDKGFDNQLVVKHPYGSVGDVLWVKETHQHTKILNLAPDNQNYGFVYRADNQPWDDYDNWKWKPSIHMPKEAARLYLKISTIGIERLHDITEPQCVIEGIEKMRAVSMDGGNVYRNYQKGATTHFPDPLSSFKSLWVSINGQQSWDNNPWVWKTTFVQTSNPNK